MLIAICIFAVLALFHAILLIPIMFCCIVFAILFVTCLDTDNACQALKSKLTGKQCKELLDMIDSTPSGKQWRDFTVSEGNELTQVNYHIIIKLMAFDIQSNEKIQYENDCKKLHLVAE